MLEPILELVTPDDVRHAELAPEYGKGRWWHFKAVARMRWLMFKISIQLRIRMWLGIERDLEIITQHIRHQERGLGFLQSDMDSQERLLQDRMNSLHGLTKSLIKGQSLRIDQLAEIEAKRGSKPRR